MIWFDLNQILDKGFLLMMMLKSPVYWFCLRFDLIFKECFWWLWLYWWFRCSNFIWSFIKDFFEIYGLLCDLILFQILFPIFMLISCLHRVRWRARIRVADPENFRNFQNEIWWYNIYLFLVLQFKLELQILVFCFMYQALTFMNIVLDLRSKLCLKIFFEYHKPNISLLILWDYYP